MKRIFAIMLCVFTAFTMTFAGTGIAHAETYDFANMQPASWTGMICGDEGDDAERFEFFMAGESCIWRNESTDWEENVNLQYNVSKSFDDFNYGISNNIIECCTHNVFCNDKYVLYLSIVNGGEGFGLNVFNVDDGSNNYTFIESEGYPEIVDVYGDKVYLYRGVQNFEGTDEGELVIIRFDSPEIKKIADVGSNCNIQRSNSGRYIYLWKNKLQIVDAKQGKITKSLSNVGKPFVTKDKITYTKFKNGVATFYQAKLGGSSSKKIFSQKLGKYSNISIEKVTSKYVYYMAENPSGYVKYYKYSIAKKKASKISEDSFINSVYC